MHFDDGAGVVEGSVVVLDSVVSGTSVVDFVVTTSRCVLVVVLPEQLHGLSSNEPPISLHLNKGA